MFFVRACQDRLPFPLQPGPPAPLKNQFTVVSLGSSSAPQQLIKSALQEGTRIRLLLASPGGFDAKERRRFRPAENGRKQSFNLIELLLSL